LFATQENSFICSNKFNSNHITMVNAEGSDLSFNIYIYISPLLVFIFHLSLNAIQM